MTAVTLYGLKNCDTCKKAMKVLEEGAVDFQFIDIRKEADLQNKVPAWMSGAGVDQLLNKRSTTWRGLSAQDQDDALNGKALELLIANPTLIKRPVIETKDGVLVGWSKDIQAMFR